ncbi:S-layer homology domain-containing protein [Neomoorella thermoacetica]|nr:S-layer homology domain-containing protein [Moorella thermoacetica]
MKKITVLTTLLALILLLTQAIPAHAEMEYRFSDKDTITKDFSWGQDDITEAIDFELYAGYPDNTLGLNNNMTRAEFAAVLSRIVDASGTPGQNWYDGAVDGLVKAGVIPDKGGNWDAPITRLEAARWLGRLAKAYQVAVKDAGATFTDTSDPDAIYAGKTGLMKGISPGVLGANQNLLRGEAAVLLLRVAKSVDSNLPSDEELKQAMTEAIDDINANIDHMRNTWKLDFGFYNSLPYKRVTQNYMEAGQKEMYAERNSGRTLSLLGIKETKIAEKHNAITVIVTRLYNKEKGYDVSPAVSRWKKVDGRWMMTQGGVPENRDLKYLGIKY